MLNDSKTAVFANVIIHVSWVGAVQSKLRLACIAFIHHHGGDECIAERISETVDLIVVHPLKSNVDQYKDHVLGRNGKAKKIVATPAFLLWCAHNGKYAPTHEDAQAYLFDGSNYLRLAIGVYSIYLSIYM